MDVKVKKILLFSTLNPYPFWAGCENLWFDFVSDERVNSGFKFHLVLADSYVTRKKAEILSSFGVSTSFYKHFNVRIVKRIFYRLADKLRNRDFKTLPWYNYINLNGCDLVLFNVAGLTDLADLYYPVSLCKKKGVPYWIILQQGQENYFLHTQKSLELVSEVSLSAKRFFFIAKKNQAALERALATKLKNAFYTTNALVPEKMKQAKILSSKKAIRSLSDPALFFNLGRFSTTEKAQHLLLEIFADKKWKERNWQLKFIGCSEFGKYYLQKLIKYYNIGSQKIQIVSHIDNVLEEIVKNDILLMPSMVEGTPFAMIESMACGKPAVGTPVGGIPELIIENETGWLARTTAVEDIDVALEVAWNERAKWFDFGANAQKLIERNYNQKDSFVPLIRYLEEDVGIV